MGLKLVVAGSLEDHAVLKYALSSTMPDAEVEVAGDGYRGVELARRTHPDLVVVDPTVPGLSGTELVARLKEAVPAAFIICWTGSGDVDEATELLRAGASAYLLKEDGPKELVRQIPSVLEGGLVIAPKVATGLADRFTHSIQRESELTRALAEATMQLQESASSKDQFVANVNHELRTPVTIVKGIAHLLKSGRLSDEDQEQFVKRMDAAVDRLTSMVDEILSVADIGQGRMTLEPQVADMSQLVNEACDRIAETYPEVTMERQVVGPLEIIVDPPRISEAMVQLLDNACRFSPSDARITVALRRVSEGVMFSVTDTGDGLRRDLLAKAFREPFVTGEEILRKERAGLGIGLHLARQLVVLHGGILWADPLPSGGTRVAFCIPERSPLFEDLSSPSGLVTVNGHADVQSPPAPQMPALPADPEVQPVATPDPRPDENELKSLLRQLIQE